jgi:preprotein translocase subunit SecD
MTQYPAAIAYTSDSLIPLVKKCLPLLYQYLPQGCTFLFKKIDNPKHRAHEIYLVKNDATAFDASRHIAHVIADMDERKHPVVSMSFNSVGTQLWKRMTTH